MTKGAMLRLGRARTLKLKCRRRKGALNFTTGEIMKEYGEQASDLPKLDI